MPFPAMSGAEPCTASKMAVPSPKFAPGAIPKPPARPDSRSERMSPNRLVHSNISNYHGLITSCMEHAATIMSFHLYPMLVILFAVRGLLQEASCPCLLNLRLLYHGTL